MNAAAEPLPPQAPAAPDLVLHLWERIQGLPPHRQAVEMLATATGRSRDVVGALSIGSRDAGLLVLHERLFGTLLTCLTDCPDCGERIEMSFHADDIRVDDTTGPETGQQTLCVTHDGWRIELRLPTGDDLAAVDGAPDLASARRDLLGRCLLRMRPAREGAPAADDPDAMVAPDPALLPVEVIERAVATMADADPQANVELDLHCPACDARWLAAFDIVTYLAAEVDAWAARLLDEVARLARGYGWREADILAMTPARRRAYAALLDSF